MRDSKMNPGNWFGGGKTQRAQVAAEANTNPLIPERSDSIFRRRSDAETYAGTPIQHIEALTVERNLTGAIVHATGVSLRQGAYDVRLSPENKGKPVDGVLTYTMKAVQRLDTPQGTERTRRVEAAQFVSNQTLGSVRQVRVVGATNVLTSGKK